MFNFATGICMLLQSFTMTVLGLQRALKSNPLKYARSNALNSGSIYVFSPRSVEYANHTSN